jgi:Big-like domain-containing protein
MRRRVILLLTTMAMTLVVASGTAMAEPLLDQQQTSSDWGIHVTSEGAYQSFTAGKTGKLDKISLYIGCCSAEGSPASDLRVSVQTATSSFTEIAQVMIPASSFTNDGSLNWVDVPFGSAAPTVQAGQKYNIWLMTWGAPPNYLWGYNGAGGYSGGELSTCYRVRWEDGASVRRCQVFVSPLGTGASADAAFKTYVTDTTPPETTIDSGPSGTVSDDAATFHFSSNEGGSKFECRFDSTSESDWSECSSPQPYPGLSEGSHVFEVRATDPSGNTDLSAASRTWTVDLPDPPPPPSVVPHVTDTDPNNGDTGVARTINPTVTFDTDLDPATVNPQNAKLHLYSARKKRWVAVSSTPSYDNKVITVTPTNTLGSQKRYRVVLNTNIESSTDTNLDQPFSFRFTTRR